MGNQILLKTITTKNKIYLCVAAILLIVATLLFVSPDVTEENNNKQTVIDKINTGNANTTIFNNEVVITNTNDAGQTNTANSNINQVVVQNNSNTNQTSTNTNNNTTQTVVTNTQQTQIISATTIDDTAIQLSNKQTSHCEALAPADWSFISNAESTGADLFSPDQTQHAGWGISAVYTYMYPDIDSFLNAWLGYAYTGSFDSDSITLVASQEIYEGFIQRDFTTTTGRKGIAIYKTYDFGDPTYYVVSVYIADTASANWETNGATPFSVALSIRCVSQLRPTTTDVDLTSSDPSSDDDNPELSLSDKWTETIMGYENVYSPSTGEHYEALSNSIWETGPEGSGYYRSLPSGGYEKLERGFGNY